MAKKTKKIANLYVYDYNESDRCESFTNERIGFVATDNEAMTAILEKFEGDWGNTDGDFEEFTRWTEDSQYYKWKLKEVIKLTEEQVESLGIDLDSLSLSIEDIEDYNPFEVEDFEDIYNDLFFNAKILVQCFEKFSNEKLDALILAIKELRK
jgi:hypothetical protein